jgi:alpha/beta superfamily hydrolase
MLPEPRGHVFFSGDDRLEGILEWPAAPDGAAGGPGGAADRAAAGATQPRLAGGVVVAHPHPLYGSTMAQPVVYRVAQACREQGFASLRFNFRGVERSRGHYSGTDEYRDVEAALSYLRGQLDDGTARRPRLGLAGYSFGSVMAAVAAGAGAVQVDALALIALVVDWDELAPGALDTLARFRAPVLALCGELDDLALPAVVERTLRGLGVDFRLTVMQGTGHLFEHKQREVGERVAAFFAETLGRKPQNV